MDAKILTFSLDFTKDIHFYGGVFIKSIEVDVLVFSDKAKNELSDKFTVDIADHSINVECSEDISYVVLPYSVMVQIGDAPVYEKMIVADSVNDLLMRKERFLSGTRFSYAGEGEYDVRLIHNSAFR